MAVIVSMTYQKKLGLPQYSSHSCSLSVQVEVNDLTQVQEEAGKLYNLLQHAVDAEIQRVGFMPDTAYGIGDNYPHQGSDYPAIADNSPYRGNNGTTPERWNCTDGQKGLILRIVSEGKFDKMEVEQIAQQLFGVGVKACNKMQASQLIEELLEKTGKKTIRRNHWRQPPRP